MKKWGEFLACWNGSLVVVIIAMCVMDSARRAYNVPIPPVAVDPYGPYQLAFVLSDMIATLTANAVYYCLASRKFDK